MAEKNFKSQSDKYVLPKEVYEKAKIAISTPKSEPVSKECERCLELVWKNNEMLMQSLVAKFIRTYGVHYKQEFLDVGVDSLLKAIQTYNPVESYNDDSGIAKTKYVMFSTYASNVILNGLRVKVKHFKTQQSKQERSVSSFEDTLMVIDGTENLLVNDVITDGSYERDVASIWQIVPNIDRLIEVLNLDYKKEQIVRMFSEGKNQEQIAKILGVTRSNISCIKMNIARPFEMLIKQGERVAILHEKNQLSFDEISKIMGVHNNAEVIYDTYKYVFYDGKKPSNFLVEFQVGSQTYKGKMIDGTEGRKRGDLIGVIRQYADVIDRLLYVTNMNDIQSNILRMYSKGATYRVINNSLSVPDGRISKVTTMFFVKIQNLQYLYKKILELRGEGVSNECIAKSLDLENVEEIELICKSFLYAFKDGEKPEKLSKKINNELTTKVVSSSAVNTEEDQR